MAKRTIADVARRRLSDDGLPNKPGKPGKKTIASSPDNSSRPNDSVVGSYYPKNADYVNGQWIRNGRVIGRSATEDSKFIPTNRSRIKGAR